MRPLFLKTLLLSALYSFSLYGEFAHNLSQRTYQDLATQPAKQPAYQEAPKKECIDPECNNMIHYPLKGELISPVDELLERLPVLFYSVEKDGKRHYLFGTAHLPIPLSNLYCQSWIEREAQNSDQIFVEVRLDSFKDYMDREFLLIMQILGASFRQELEWLSLKNKLEHIKQTIIEKNIELRIDSQIEYLANGLDIPIIGLDDENFKPPKFIIEANRSKFSELIAFARVNSIEDTLERLKVPPQHFLANRYLYILMNLLFDNSLNLLEKDKEKARLVFGDRNKVWFEKFKTAHEDPELEHLFLAVGSGHFIGPDNLLDMLIEDGFSIWRIDCGIDELLSFMNKNEDGADAQ